MRFFGLEGNEVLIVTYLKLIVSSNLVNNMGVKIGFFGSLDNK